MAEQTALGKLTLDQYLTLVVFYHHIQHFQLGTLVDTFVSSCFVHLRKPDADIFRLALDVAQVDPAHVLYLDNTAMFIEIAAQLGIRGIHHRSYLSTRRALQSAGLSLSPDRHASGGGHWQ